MLCDYGCGQEAKYQFKNGKWCCEKHWNKCLVIRKEHSGKNHPMYGKTGKDNPNYGSHRSEDTKKLMSCSAKNKSSISEETREKMSLSQIRRWKDPKNRENQSKKRKEYFTKNPEEKEKMRLSSIKWWKEHPTLRKIYKEEMLSGKASYVSSFSHTEEINKNVSKANKKNMLKWWKEHPEEKKKLSKRQKEYMLNGGAVIALSGVRNPSKPQVELFKLIKEIFPEAILNYPVKELNYSLDIAIPSLMIDVEYDCWYWHQDKQTDYKRQKELENIGWRIVRYKDYIPSKNKLLKDIKEIN